MKKPVIYTESNDCQDCYKCIKECPVKSIKMEGNSAAIISESCIYCGQCVLTCPVKAKRHRDDLSKVIHWLDSGEKVVAMIAPSLLTDFDYLTTDQIVKIFYRLGFVGISETAIGADVVAKKVMDWLDKQKDGVYISSCCPAVVNYLHIYLPEALNHLTPIMSPMVVHAKILRETLFPDAKLVFIGPCIAKKDESDAFPQYVDAAVTFQALKRWFDDERVELYPLEDIHPTDDFIIGRPGIGTLFPVDGGMLTTMCEKIKSTETNFMTFSGMEQVIDICKELPQFQSEGKLFLELMACKGGCIKGPAMINYDGVVAKRKALIDMHGRLQKSTLPYKPLPIIEDDWKNDSFVRQYQMKCIHTEEEITEVLHSMGKWSSKDELNCMGCGYDSCRALATAMLEGKAYREMCISCMRKESQHKASILLQKMPYGVVLVDDKLNVLDANYKLVEMLGEDAKLAFEATGLKGVNLKKLIPFYKHFESVLSTGVEVIEHDIRDGENYYHLSLMSIHRYKTVCGILQNMHQPEVQQELILERIRNVIRQNVENVQQIAYLLGESASFTESMLNSVIDSHKKQH